MEGAFQLDEVDRRVIHALMADARNTSAPAIAEGLGVSAGTIRNRIARLEDAGIIKGYHAHVDFERADGRLTNLYLCNAPVAERESIAARVRTVPGVVHVRELMTGRRNLHVLAVGEDIADLRRVARALSSLGIEIEDEDLVQADTYLPYAAYEPEGDERRGTLSDFVSLTGGSEIVEATIGEGAPIDGLTLSEAGERGLLSGNTLVISVDRGDTVVTPRGDTVLRAGDEVTLFSRGDVPDETLAALRNTE
ncbi:winged helix-turn-helix transcriptional regulator [Haloprofundus salinisoli]|uniref:winged helix-turn-helix transcriptional regulator n=1 Tax=Haloprofundus salinisoli TaxID=2876193 RepID=UPI001CCC8821|nr:Lrp/AsnC family transcriptional regulator [Haloprofundus salinisoli]